MPGNLREVFLVRGRGDGGLYSPSIVSIGVSMTLFNGPWECSVGFVWFRVRADCKLAVLELEISKKL